MRKACILSSSHYLGRWQTSGPFKSLPRQMADLRSLALMQVSKSCLSSHKNFFYKIRKHLLIQFFVHSEEFKFKSHTEDTKINATTLYT